MPDTSMEALAAVSLESRRLTPSKRLAYVTTGRCDVIPMKIDAPPPLEPGEVLGAFKSVEHLGYPGA